MSSLELFKRRAKALADEDEGEIKAYLADAATFLGATGPEVFGTSYPLACVWLAAHEMWSDMEAETNPGQPAPGLLTSVKTRTRSESFAVKAADNLRDAGLQTTWYGRNYLELRAAVSPGVMII